MKIKNLFRTKRFNTLEPELESPSPRIEVPAIPEQLFIDHNSPINGDEPTTPIKESLLGQFLQFDYQSKGKQEGYQYHNREIKELVVNKIKSDFLFVLEKSIDGLQIELMQKEILKQGVSGLSETINNQLLTVIDQLKMQIIDLTAEKEFVAQNLGLIQSAIGGYELGFAEGMELFVQDQILFGKINKY